MRKARPLSVLLVVGGALLVGAAWRTLVGTSAALGDAPLAPVAPSAEAATLDGVAAARAPGTAREAVPGDAGAPSHTPALPTTALPVTARAPLAIRGVVVDARGAPVPGAAVSAEHDLWAGAERWSEAPQRVDTFVTTDTDHAGRFALPLPMATVATVRASHPGYVPTVARSVPPDADLRLVLTPEATLEGEVLDAHDRAPVPEAPVRVLHGPALDEATWVRADGLGRFRIGGLAAGVVGVTAAPESHVVSRWHEVELAAGSTTRVEVVVERGRVLTGVVRDAATLAVLPGARVSAWDFFGKTVTTDDVGRFRIDGVGPLPGSLTADAPGYGRAEVKFAAGSPGDEPLEVELALTRALRLEGRVVDARATPIPAAVVVANGRAFVDGVDRREWREAVTGDDGRFVIEGARRDVPLAVQVRAAGFGARRFAAPAPDLEGVVRLGDLALAPQATLGGRVLERLGGPVADAYVGVQDAGAAQGFDVTLRNVSTDRAGRFLFVGLEPGAIVVRVSAPDGRVVVREVILRGGEHMDDLVLELPGGEALRGRVIDGTSRLGLADASVSLTRGTGAAYERRSARCDEAGEFELVAVPAGEWVASASLERDEDPRTPVYGTLRRTGVVADGTYLELLLERLDTTLGGRVLDSRGEPVAQCYVARLVDGVPRQDSGVLTDSAGEFTVLVPSGKPVALAAYATTELRGDVNMTVLDHQMRRRVLLDAGPIASATATADTREVILRPAPE
ncbi:MAG: carboxypeptidase regulatory-like domain-containing protein [Planctomycetota bacterium]